VRESAGHVRELLAELGMLGFPKTTGSKGIHIYVRVEPGWDSFAVRGAVVALAREMARRRPELITDEWWKEARGERVFIDYNQNAPHKNMFGAWGVRPRVGAQVSTPFGWDELDTIDPETCTIDTVPDRLADLGDPWELMDDAECTIAPLVEAFADDLARGVPDAPWPPVYPKMPNEAPRVQPSRARKHE
jgi:DNA primase